MAVYLGTNKVSAKGGFITNSVVDTSDATATANDIMNGKTAYTASGKTNGTYTPLDTSDATASAGHILYGKTAYANDSKITGTMTNQGTVTGSISSKTASYTIPAGYHNGSGKVSIDSTEQSKIIASNIKSGVSILGVTGTCTASSSGTDTSDATASAANILSGQTAYIKGSKVTGTMTNNGAVTGTISTKAGSYTIPTGYHSGSGKVSISATEQNKIIASNIKLGVSILGVTGTYTGESSSGSSGNNNCEAYIIDATNPTVSFKSSGTVKVYGYATASGSSGWGGYGTTMYAFAGTSYYKSTAYGSPTSTSLNLSISNGKITGLPTMTGGTLIAVIGV